MLTNATGKPDNYAELYEHYFGFMKAIVARSGINPQDVEDVATDILVKFIEKDGLSWYDPTLLHDVGENPLVPGARYRPAKFQAMLRSWTSKSCLNHRDKQATRLRKEPIRCEQQVDVDRESSEAVTWLEAQGETKAIDMDLRSEFWESYRQALEVLEAQPVRGKRDLARAFRTAVQMEAMDGKVDRKQMAIEFECSDSVIGQIFRDMREVLRDNGFGPESPIWSIDGVPAAALI